MAGTKLAKVLDSDVRALSVRLKARQTSDENELYHKEKINQLLAEILSQSDNSGEVRGYSIPQLVSQLELLNEQQHSKFHGHLDQFFGADGLMNRSLWREQEVIGVIYMKGAIAVPTLIASSDRAFNPLVLYALGVIGGRKSATYLMDRAKTEANVWCLTDYYYCALLTRDSAARKTVEEIAELTVSGNRPTAAKSALKMKLPAVTKIIAAGTAR